MSSGPPSLPTEGSIIAGKYRLENLLGEGGMGSVWRAYNVQLQVPVALKLLRADLGSTDLGDRLRVEARAAARLAHPSIVRVFDIGEAETGEPFIVMEMLVGESLGDVLERGPITPEHAVSLMLPIAEALGVAHSRGVVHRDLKPDNIFLATEGSGLQPKLLDFGIAKVTGGVGATEATLTQTGTLLGSPDYMSPEQAYGRSDIDERSDIWSFCIVLYEAIAGRTPFVGETCQTLLRSVVSEPAPPLSSFAPVDARLAALIESGLAKDRDQRPASILTLGQQLATWLLEQGVQHDATGASIESKWLGRGRAVRAAPAAASEHAQHDQATLVSVVHPAPRLVSTPEIAVAQVRRRAWLPSLAGLAALALFGYGLTALKLEARDAPGTAQAAELDGATLPAATVRSDEPAAAPTVTTLPLVTIDALPVETTPTAVAGTTGRKRPTVLAVVPSSPPRVNVTATARVKPSLPQAIPARNSRADLINPY